MFKKLKNLFKPNGGLVDDCKKESQSFSSKAADWSKPEFIPGVPCLGDEVMDEITGFRGVIVSEHNYLYGCTRMTVQPLIDKDGKLPESITFDIDQLKILKQKKHLQGNTSVGGPEKYMPQARNEDKRREI